MIRRNIATGGEDDGWWVREIDCLAALKEKDEELTDLTAKLFEKECRIQDKEKRIKELETELKMFQTSFGRVKDE